MPLGLAIVHKKPCTRGENCEFAQLRPCALRPPLWVKESSDIHGGVSDAYSMSLHLRHVISLLEE